MAQRVGMTSWQWAILLEFLGQGCVFLVAKGWGLPTTDLVFGSLSSCLLQNTTTQELMFPRGRSEAQGRGSWQKEATCAPAVPSSEGKRVIGDCSKETAGENPQK